VYRRSATALAFALLAVLVAAGASAHVDQWSVSHLMPGAHFRRHGGGLSEGLIPLAHAHWHGALAITADIVLLPASFLIALAIVAWRSRRLALALVAAVAVEVICKEAIVRPALYHGALHVGAFDSSFPSGHALRAVIVAAAVAPLVGIWAGAWLLAALVLLLVAGWHTPTDIAGGVLLGGLALLCVGRARAPRAHGLRA
jgi:membrane-associated phospholipid phosphatase